MEKVQIGLIGCGVISAAYLRAVRAFPMLEILALADARPAAAEKRAREFGLPAVEVEALLGDPEIELAWDLRYHGQSHELTVRGGDDDLRERFEALHEERYGHRDPDGEVEFVTVRVTGRLPAEPLEFGGAAGERVAGPDVVRLPEATLVVPEGWRGATDDTGTLILEREP